MSPTSFLRRRDRPVALVTGGGRGIGRLVAQALAHEGMAVALIARSADELDETVALIESAGGTAAAAVADVTDDGAMADAVADFRGCFGPVDLLINNAGILGPTGPAWDVDLDDWWRAMEVNLLGTLRTTRLILPEMVERRQGRIVNVTSHAGVFRWPLVSGYSVSKAAVVKLTENLAHETQRYGISVFSVHPGLLPIGLSEPALTDCPSGSSGSSGSAGSAGNPYQAQIYSWVRQQLASRHGADPARAVDLVVNLASGRYDALSGLQLSVHDDLDAVLAGLDDVHDRNLYLLSLNTLPTPRSA
jgi:NAD(P)-dependent dehydrogenase (short-subunit alcohol dehydrogenase family)